MKFPALNIQQTEWDPQKYVDPILLNRYLKNTNIELFKNQLLNKKFCDSNGEIFIIANIVEPTSFVRNAFKFIPGVYKCTLEFKKTGTKMPLEDLRQFILERVNSISINEFKLLWNIKIKTAKTHAEIIDKDIYPTLVKCVVINALKRDSLQ